MNLLWKLNRDNRFTLLELMIVIALIMMLAGLLLPALKTAKEQSSRISCANNMKQIYLGCMGYADDSSDYMPPASYDIWDSVNAGYYLSWMTFIHPYINGKEYDGGRVKTSQAMYCLSGKNESLLSGFAKPLTNYMYSDYLGFCNSTWGYPTYPLYGPHRRSKCTKPSQFAILIDGKCKTRVSVFYEIANHNSALTWADIRHSAAINTLFVEGHVEKDRILSRPDGELLITYGWYLSWKP